MDVGNDNIGDLRMKEMEEMVLKYDHNGYDQDGDEEIVNLNF